MDEDIIVQKFAKRFAELIKENNTKIPTLMKLLGMSKTSVYRYLNAEIPPKLTTIKCLAQYYNVNPTWLSGIDVPKADLSSRMVVNVPVIEKAEYINEYKKIENWIDLISVDIPKESSTDDYFALKVTEDTKDITYPIFLCNDIIIFKKNNKFEDNKISIMLLNEKIVIKVVKIINEGIILVPLDANKDSIFYSKKDIEEKHLAVLGEYYESRRKDIKL